MKRLSGLVIVLLFCYCTFAQTTSPLIALNQYTAFFLNDFTSGQVDCQGRIAVGGNVNLTKYEVGTLIPNDCSEYGLVVGNNLYYNQGTVNEMIIYGGTASVEDVSDSCGAVQGVLIDFGTAFDGLESASKTIAAAPVNGQTLLSYSSLQITGTANETFVVVDYTTLSFVTAISLSVPENSWLFITVTGNDVTLENLDITNSASTNASYVLWNFAEATSLTMTGLPMFGSVLAPNAAIQFTNGHIDGSICGASFYGNGELHWYPYVPPSTPCVCPVCPPSITFPPYSIFALKDVNLTSTDDQGAMGAGGDVTLNSYEVGTLISSNPPQEVLTVGGNLVFTNGMINGYAVVAGSASVSGVGGGTVYNNTAINVDFTSDFQDFVNFANALSTLPSNGNIAFSQDGELVLTAKGQFNVFLLSGFPLSQVNTWTINADEGAEVIVNIPSSVNSLANVKMNLVGGIQNTTIILNFFETTSLTITQTSAQGTIFAPNAVVSFYDANIEGDLICVSVYGDGEVHLSPPVPIQPVCPPCNCPPSLSF